MTDETATANKKEKLVIQYAINDAPITNPSVNSLSGVAYFYTKGVDGKPQGRIGVKRLTEILNGLGVQNPASEAFSNVTLPNDKALSATVGELAERVPRVKKADRPEVKADRQAKLDRLERNKNAQAQAKALKAWKEGGEVGERPDTTDFDALTVALARKPTKGSKKAAQVTKAVKSNGGSIKPTKANGRTIRKAPAKKAAAKKAPAAKKAAPTTAKVLSANKFAGAKINPPARKPLERKFVTPLPKAGASKKAAN